MALCLGGRTFAMKGNELIVDLIREVKKTRTLLMKIDSFYNEFLREDLPLLGRKKSSAVVIAEVMIDFYTCLETLFVKISQFFKNNLQKDKWHTDLLHKMTLEIEGTRKPVISDETYVILMEFMKFRHFKRYYYELDYDWDKLAFLEKKYKQVKPLLERDVKTFLKFLEELRGM